MKKLYIEGYKIFNSKMQSYNNIQFKVGEIKHIDSKIKAGPVDGNGFHMCKNFYDTFRYCKNDETPILCEVIGFGNISDEYIDEYYGYYDIYAVSDIFVKRIIPRAEIIEMAKHLNIEALKKLIITFKMTNKEIEEINKSFNSATIKKYIKYYHYHDKKAFD